MIPKKWDNYFHEIVQVVASNSPCMSVKIGAILVKDLSIIATGYNGPPRQMPHCDKRIRWDRELQKYFKDYLEEPSMADLTNCPRKLLHFKSGEGLDICPAVHAEANCIAEAARIGVPVKGSTMYVTCGVPCKNCLGLMINAGVSA